MLPASPLVRRLDAWQVITHQGTRSEEGGNQQLSNQRSTATPGVIASSLGFLIVLAMLAGVVVLFWWLFGFVRQAVSTLSFSVILGAALTGLAGLIKVSYEKYSEQQGGFQSSLFEKRIVVYSDLLYQCIHYLELMNGTDKKVLESARADLLHTLGERRAFLLLWSGDEVIKKAAEVGQSLALNVQESNSNKTTATKLSELVIVLRRDLGHRTRRLKSKTLLELTAPIFSGSQLADEPIDSRFIREDRLIPSRDNKTSARTPSTRRATSQLQRTRQHPIHARTRSLLTNSADLNHPIND